jgi:hypothetical protein
VFSVDCASGNTNTVGNMTSQGNQTVNGTGGIQAANGPVSSGSRTLTSTICPAGTVTGAWCAAESATAPTATAGAQAIWADSNTHLPRWIGDIASTAYNNYVLTTTGTTTSTTQVPFSTSVAGVHADRAITSLDLPTTLPNQTSINGTSIPSSATLPIKICSQVAVAMPTTQVNSAATGSTATGSCTGLTTSDSITCTAAVQISTVTGFAPTTNGWMTIEVWPSSGTINAAYVNNTAGNITPGALTLNCEATR